jgi:hypothetical protein
LCPWREGRLDRALKTVDLYNINCGKPAALA